MVSSRPRGRSRNCVLSAARVSSVSGTVREARRDFGAVGPTLFWLTCWETCSSRRKKSTSLTRNPPISPPRSPVVAATIIMRASCGFGDTPRPDE